MAASVLFAICSVAGGFVPYLGVYQIIRLFLERRADWEGILSVSYTHLDVYKRQPKDTALGEFYTMVEEKFRAKLQGMTLEKLCRTKP